VYRIYGSEKCLGTAPHLASASVDGVAPEPAYETEPPPRARREAEQDLDQNVHGEHDGSRSLLVFALSFSSTNKTARRLCVRIDQEELPTRNQ
jgi:hypothetical protein